MKRPDEVTAYLRCGGMNCDNACSTQLDRLGVEDCLTWRIHGYVQQLEERVVHLEALNQQNLSVITMQERTRARLEERISQLESQSLRWISVEEKGPVFPCVVYDGHNPPYTPSCGIVMLEDHDGKKQWIPDLPLEATLKGELPKFCRLPVTHWMPLPQPPKEAA